ncbi:hypothetical protein [Mucilaginibacter sp. L3T2-6]|uniref:hypothetical protein n=1 Tax=Mucilaginibacter sp. L3T2-6 TaxID=3062491 RepID=UPI00267689AD|nr:hypothetical protein [Mucilaginibacter sp. L3T2-6]MDO3642328.1 hypothetical protein [Mucilaginibacter sp. L3T2-6]MDV6214823.1 hypothetical protein [Mucilaginibacter sp. L3T2-6]
MKSYNKTAPSKLLAKFDNELKDLLASDLKSFMNRNPFFLRRKLAMANNTLFVA